MEIKVDIVDYMGKFENGILVLLSVNCDGSFSEGTIFYTSDNLALTVSEEVEKKIGTKIELWEGYQDLLTNILKKLIPCEELITRMDEVDFSKYLEYDGETGFVEDEIDPDDIEFKE
jgi:hypothetical protein